MEVLLANPGDSLPHVILPIDPRLMVLLSIPTSIHQLPMTSNPPKWLLHLNLVAVSIPTDIAACGRGLLQLRYRLGLGVESAGPATFGRIFKSQLTRKD